MSPPSPAGRPAPASAATVAREVASALPRRLRGGLGQRRSRCQRDRRCACHQDGTSQPFGRFIVTSPHSGAIPIADPVSASRGNEVEPTSTWFIEGGEKRCFHCLAGARDMGLNSDAAELTPSAASDGKAPRTARGEKTLRKILDAALAELESGAFRKARLVGLRAGRALRWAHSTPISPARTRSRGARARHVRAVCATMSDRHWKARDGLEAEGRRSRPISIRRRPQVKSTDPRRSRIRRSEGFRAPLCDHRREYAGAWAQHADRGELSDPKTRSTTMSTPGPSWG